MMVKWSTISLNLINVNKYIMGRVLAKKRWLRLIPVVFITYSLAYLDRANFGFAAAGGMAHDLNITPAVSSLLGSLFFSGLFLFSNSRGIVRSK